MSNCVQTIEIAQIPAIFRLSRDYGYSMLVWMVLETGTELEALYNQHGNPELDPGLIDQINLFFDKKLKLMIVAGEEIYCQQTQTWT